MNPRGIALRCAYGAGLAATAVLAFSAAPLFLATMQAPPEFARVLNQAAWMGFAVVAVPMLVLTVRPYWWGKIYVLWPALSWLGFVGAMSAITGAWSPLMFIPLAFSAVMFAIAVTHQIVDPRFSGAPLR